MIFVNLIYGHFDSLMSQYVQMNKSHAIQSYAKVVFWLHTAKTQWEPRFPPNISKHLWLFGIRFIYTQTCLIFVTKFTCGENSDFYTWQMFCCKISWLTVYAVLPWNLFCRDLCAFCVEKNCSQKCGEKITNMMYAPKHPTNTPQTPPSESSEHKISTDDNRHQQTPSDQLKWHRSVSEGVWGCLLASVVV